MTLLSCNFYKSLSDDNEGSCSHDSLELLGVAGHYEGALMGLPTTRLLGSNLKYYLSTLTSGYRSA